MKQKDHFHNSQLRIEESPQVTSREAGEAHQELIQRMIAKF